MNQQKHTRPPRGLNKKASEKYPLSITYLPYFSPTSISLRMLSYILQRGSGKNQTKWLRPDFYTFFIFGQDSLNPKNY